MVPFWYHLSTILVPKRYHFAAKTVPFWYQNGANDSVTRLRFVTPVSSWLTYLPTFASS
jgi:hypothetical protein